MCPQLVFCVDDDDDNDDDDHHHHDGLDQQATDVSVLHHFAGK